jgi:hypothetical protein
MRQRVLGLFWAALHGDGRGGAPWNGNLVRNLVTSHEKRILKHEQPLGPHHGHGLSVRF